MKINKHNSYQIAAAALIVLIAGFFLFRKDTSEQPKSGSQNADFNGKTELNAPADIKILDSEPVVLEGGLNQISGVLLLSDDQKKGNLKLAAGSHTVYINTSRDYSELYGGQVNVKFKGTLDNFTLIDITK